jgi:8-oxo-dGTP diphosphatase
MRAVAVCLIWNDQGEVLLAQKSDGLWEFPGGKQEPEETLMQCAEREIREELNLQIEALEKTGPQINISKTFAPLQLELVTCRLLSGSIQLHEHVQAKWVSPMELQQHELCPPDAALWLMYLEQLRFTTDS